MMIPTFENIAPVSEVVAAVLLARIITKAASSRLMSLAMSCDRVSTSVPRRPEADGGKTNRFNQVPGVPERR